MASRAKFHCTKETRTVGGSELQRVFEFNAVYDDERFTKFTPWGHIEVAVDNPDVNFQVGKNYYVDITEAE